MHQCPAVNQMRGLIAAAPEPLREQMHGLSMPNLLTRCQTLKYDSEVLHDPTHATTAALTLLAARVAALSCEISILDRQLRPLLTPPHRAPAHCLASDPTWPPSC